MSQFKKNYIGKGKQVGNMDIVRVSINMEMIQQFITEYEGQKYLHFEVAKLRQADKFGKTHTVYVSAPEPEEETQEA
jgi:hypothetical protein